MNFNTTAKSLDWSSIDRVIINLTGEWVGMGNVIMTSPLVESIHRINPKCKIYILITGDRWLPIVKLMSASPIPVVVNQNFYRLRWLYLNAILRFRRSWITTVYFYDYLAPRMRASLFGKLIDAQYCFGYGKNGDEKENIPTDNLTELPFSAPGVLSFDYSNAFKNITGLKYLDGPRLAKHGLIEKGKKILSDLGIQKEQTLFAFHPGCSPVNRIKKWPISSFSKLAEMVSTKGNAEVLVILGPGEDRLKQEWHNPNYVNFIENYPISDVAAILSCVDYIVSNDSGIMHLAFALGMPGVGIFGPTTFENYVGWYPHAKFVHSDMKCRPCYSTDHYLECGNTSAPCMSNISVEDVLAKVREVIPDGLG